MENEAELKKVFKFLVQLEDQTYIEEVISYLLSNNLMPEAVYRLRNSIQSRKQKAKGYNPIILQEKPDVDYQSTAKLIQSSFRKVSDILPEQPSANPRGY